ncbi:hypothetical protein BCR35DRAFT_317225 [Leucosporidium creatinivorum]|uniref:FAD/NAD(P)-binding domain-containing protein n=1 Tax=Leucosporidium creatinivorum TaxID=106004 RepID=A0A1Y2G012_9BASI|nr:hypothetical protein BCR35DRAFT_317225 [Leucosporidium creatinivorum]
MRVCIVGAGFSGLVTAKTLIDFGHEVTVFELAPDVGGVWSSTRSYPGVKTQNSKQTYCLSTLAMPSSYPDHPSGEQVQAYLESYVKQHALREIIQLNTEVTAAEQVVEGWIIQTRSSSGSTSSHSFEHLVVCSGAFSKPFLPSFLGAESFVAGGGRICHTSQLGCVEDVKGKNVIIVGYGKSACDAAQVVSDMATSTTVVARRLLWKLPTYVLGVLHYSYLLLNRVVSRSRGESLFEYIRPWKSQRFLSSRLGSPIRAFAFRSLEWAARFQYSLDSLSLLPSGPYSDIATSTVSLATLGFYQGVKSGRIAVIRDASITSLSARSAMLSTGQQVAADLVVCGTGWEQVVPFLPQELHHRMIDSNGNWLLYRHILPPAISNLTFNGFNSSLFCPLTAEITSLWIASYLSGDLPLPSAETQLVEAKETLEWMERRAKGKHAHGTNLVPFSLSNIDDMLGDLGLKLGRLAHLREWLLPVDPTAYKGLGEQLRVRLVGGSKVE